MFAQPPRTASEDPMSPDAALDELREGGPAALAERLRDADFLLTAVATDPATMFETGTAERREFMSLLDALHEVRSSLEALEARTVVALAERTRRDQIEAARHDPAHEDALRPPLERLIRQADSRTALDLSLATRRSPAVAGATLASARRLVGSMPRMLGALGRGKVTAQVAYAAAASAAPLDAETRRQVDEMLHERMPQLDGAGVKAWRAAVAQAAGELDPDGAARRHLAARRDRHVSFTPGEHGMATVSAHLPALDAKLVHKRLSLEAERRRAEGSGDGHGALMADAFVDTVLGRAGGMEPVTLDLGVMITERALLDPGCGDLAHVEGYGPVPAEALREELREALADPAEPADDRYGPDGPQVRAVMRRLYRHPMTRELVAVESRAREFPPAMKRFLRWRDGTCRAPYCDAAVRQYDHIAPACEGGMTSVDNGQGLCARCNLRKEEAAARVERLADRDRAGHLVSWTGHGGTTVTSSPPSLGRRVSGDGAGHGADPPTGSGAEGAALRAAAT